MESQREWAAVWARFDGLKANPPSYWSTGEVAKYHDILAAIEQASGEDLSVFRIADGELKQKPLSISRAGRRSPGSVTMSAERYCSDQHMRQQMDGVILYFANLQPPDKPKPPIGF